MENENAARIYSFVSGKGGVGKTSIAANYAWVSAQSRKTVLIDMDLQNQGMTGLLERYLSKAPLGAFELLSSPSKKVNLDSCLVKICENLLFLPASSAKVDPSPTELARLLSNPTVGENIQRLLEHLRELTGFEVLVLDCHGGLDYLSLGAHYASDLTILVTEADSVTFNGTLELMSFYQNVPDEVEWCLQKRALPVTPPIQLLINRIPARFTYADLDRVYRKVLSKMGAEYKLGDEVLAYFPQENFLADSFGEYPFCAELAPNSVFSKKLWLMDYILSNGRVLRGNLNLSKSVHSSKFRKRVKLCITSNEAMNTKRMLSAFSVLTVAFTLYGLVALPIAISTKGLETLSRAFLFSSFTHNLLMILALMFMSTISLSLVRAMWGAIKFYSDKYSFRRKLWTVSGRRLRLGERLLLGRLLIVRITFFVPLIVFAVFLLYIPLFAVLYGYVYYTEQKAPAAVHSFPVPVLETPALN